MKKLIKTALFIALIPGLVFADANRMAFLKEKLITTPKEQAATTANIIKKIIPAIGLPMLFDWGCLKGTKHLVNLIVLKVGQLPLVTPKQQAELEQSRLNFQTELGKVHTQFLPGLRSIIIYYIAHRIIVSRLEKTNLQKFIIEWESNKKHTPKELQPAFEQLYSEYQQKKSLDSKKLAQIKNRVKQIIHAKSLLKG